MAFKSVPLVICAAGVLAGGFVTRRILSEREPATAATGRRGFVAGRFVIARDVPALGLWRGEQLRVEPSAPVRQGDVVAVRTESAEIVLTRFHDELMHCTAGLVVREAPALSRA